ncbi:hypothetical protein AJ78_04781 [Emergomyces pasteurianus Ep9510]|uniref:C6 finger domain transcription factor nscR n=1 Tax=Emergomyces pasteurianus Ep9510 TaxID=1447872 RepID=A0A1J9PG92_9EURO|nr:hypothetical protein AJ78_04781 [Emergomyces pasteurianus Ep9510]
MADLNPSATATLTSDDPPRKHPQRRRERPQLSCTTCRKKKLKCDRNLPCENCATRGRGDTCVYANPPPPGHSRAIQHPVNRATMQGRVRHLEKMVMALAREKSPASGSSQSWSTPTEFRSDGGEIRDYHFGYRFETYASGSTRSENHEDSTIPPIESIESAQTLNLPTGGDSRYFDSGHWASILSDIGELKGYFEDQGEYDASDSAAEAGHCVTETDLLSGRFARLTQMEILDQVPPKPLADTLISRYLSSDDQPIVLVHGPSFRKQYELFWQDPWSTPITWVSKLFSIMCIALRAYAQSGEQMPESVLDPMQLVDQYRQMAVHCLFAGNYATGPPHAVEALILYFFTEYTRNPDMQLPCWLLFGVIIRVAMRKGYHRDPRHHPGLSVFEGELRRRAWTVLFHMDLLTAVDAGMPRMINPLHMDAELPRCILDEDIDENTIELPPPRPDAACPGLAYVNAKRPMILVYGNIVDMNNSRMLAPYEEILKLDKALADSYRVIPPLSKQNPTEPPVTDPPALIMRRLTLDLMYQKGRCILHRKYYTISWNNPQYTYSRHTCIEAAMATLQQHAVLYRETQPGGVVHHFRWMRTSLISHESLLASMILCLYLDRLNQQDAGRVEIDNITPERRSEMLKLLRSAYAILSESARSSKVGARACGVLNIILQRVGIVLPMPNDIINEAVPMQPTDGIVPPSAAAGPGSGCIRTVPAVPMFYSQDGVYSQAPSGPVQMPLPINHIGLVDPEDMFFNPETITIQNFIQFPQEVDWNQWDNLFRPHDWEYPFDMSQLG